MRDGIIRFGRDICADLRLASEREWLETNGLGGFASSTIAGLNTRRYHGLLTAALKPPGERFVLLSKLEETLLVDGVRHELSVNQYPGVIHPQGHRYLTGFRLDPFPVFEYDVDGAHLTKRVFMAHGENTTVIEYELRGKGACVLEVRPLIAFREYHGTTHRNHALRSSVEMAEGLAAVKPYDELPALHFAHDAAKVEASGCWYQDFEYAAEQERGLDYREDLFSPMCLSFPSGSGTIIASLHAREASQAPGLRAAEIRRRARIANALPGARPLVKSLVSAADHFVVKRGDRKTVIAGYHWFSDWGRDTMIALPGLTLTTGRPEVARDVLLAFLESADRGMLPNRFPDTGETPEYNTVDATLWLFEAIRAYAAYTRDFEFVRNSLYARLKEIVEWQLKGTRYGIRVDKDGLLASGAPGVQLTWMDSKIGEWVVTPRRGKPVEIQALWYNALRIMEDFSRRFGDTGPEAFFREMAAHARESFNAAFWNGVAGCLFDVVDDDQRDAALRPNQIFAVSLTHTMVSGERARQVVETVQRELLTPLGLRSLSPRDAQYRGTYAGGVTERDSAYHQGTVWPWLLGPFLTAYVKVNGRSAEVREQAARWLEPVAEHLRTAGLGHISEIADADAPHTPRGCIAQAWSVAEILRAAVEDVFGADEVSEDQGRHTDSDDRCGAAA